MQSGVPRTDSGQVEPPHSKKVRDKIQQLLQVLRDKGLLEFLGGGRYRLVQVAGEDYKLNAKRRRATALQKKQEPRQRMAAARR